MADNVNDLCECIRQTLRRQLSAVEAILQSAGSQDAVTPEGGFGNGDEALGLSARPQGDGISNTMLVTAVFVVLFTVFMLAAGRQAGPRRVEDPAAEKRDRNGGGGGGADFFDDGGGPAVH